jgi:hypothetical protein
MNKTRIHLSIPTAEWKTLQRYCNGSIHTTSASGIVSNMINSFVLYVNERLPHEYADPCADIPRIAQIAREVGQQEMGGAS